MRKIPLKLREEMANDPYYQKCCLSNLECIGRVEWHHNLIFAGRQVNEKFCILPLCNYHHNDIIKYKYAVDLRMLNRATDEELKRYSKSTDYIRLRNEMNKGYILNHVI